MLGAVAPGRGRPARPQTVGDFVDECRCVPGPRADRGSGAGRGPAREARRAATRERSGRSHRKVDRLDGSSPRCRGDRDGRTEESRAGNRLRSRDGDRLPRPRLDRTGRGGDGRRGCRCRCQRCARRCRARARGGSRRRSSGHDHLRPARERARNRSRLAVRPLRRGATRGRGSRFGRRTARLRARRVFASRGGRCGTRSRSCRRWNRCARALSSSAPSGNRRRARSGMHRVAPDEAAFPSNASTSARVRTSCARLNSPLCGRATGIAASLARSAREYRLSSRPPSSSNITAEPFAPVNSSVHSVPMMAFDSTPRPK